MSENVFDDEWRECLRAHYIAVIRNEDKVTQPSLTALMMDELGYGEDELRQLRVIATMHVDDVGADYVPDLNILAEEAPAEVFISIPEPEPELMPEMEAEPDVVDEMVEEEAPPQPAKDAPQQLSLF
jgi:hypothetical protein